MSKKIYVGSLSHEVDDKGLRLLFEPHGEVLSATVVKDRETSRSKGFGFVEMASDACAMAAIAAINGQSIEGQTLSVSEAKPGISRFRGRSGGFGRSGDRPSGGPRF